MHKAIFTFILAVLLTGSAWATDITIGATTLTGFNRTDIGSDVAVSSISATSGSPTITCSSCFPSSVVGLPGWRITIDGIDYTALSVPSRSSVTLTGNFGSSTGTYSGTLRKFIQLRVWVSGQAFTPSGETVPIPQGSGTGNVYKRVAASVVNDGIDNILYLSEFELPATTNGTPATSRWAAGLYTPAGGFIQSFPGCIDSWRLNHAEDPTSWSGICSYNVPPPLTPTDTVSFYTKNEINGFLPSCSVNQAIYFAATGRPQSCLTIGSGLSLVGGVLSSSVGGSAYSQIQEEGSNLTQRSTFNFIGSGLTAADDSGSSRTNVTVNGNLNALASNSTPGLWAVTGAGTGVARTLQQPAAGITIAEPAGTAGDPTFALANDLAAVEGLSGAGLSARTAADTWSLRSLVQPPAGIAITNPAGTAGDPTFALANDLAALEGLSGTGIAVRSATDTWVQRQLVQPIAGLTITNADGVSGNITFALADDLAGVETISATGLATRVTAGVWTARSLVQPANGITITNADGTLGNPTFVLADDLAAVEGLSTTGLATRTALNTWTTRTITGTASQITVTNGDGVSGNPTLSTPQNIATTSTPTFAGMSLSGSGNPVLTVNQTSTGNIQNWQTGGANIAILNSTGLLQTRAGNGSTPSADAITVGGLYAVSTSVTGNVGGGEDDLISKTVAANVFGTDGDTAFFRVAGNWTAGASTRVSRLYYAGVLIVALSSASTDQKWLIEGTMTRVDATNMRWAITAHLSPAAGTSPTQYFAREMTTSATHSSANIFKCTGESSGATNNDVTQTISIIWKGTAP